MNWDKAREFCEAGADLSEWGSRVSARVKYSGGGGGMGSKAYTISKGSIAYHAPGSSYLRECQDMGVMLLSAILTAAEHRFPFRGGKADPHDLQAHRRGI